MTISKLLFLIIITYSLSWSQTIITIYNQNKAFINEIRELNLNKLGEQYISIYNIPINADPSSINLSSDNIQFNSKEFINNPITIQSMLNASIGKQIELIKYDDDGNISFSTIGKLISNNNQPVFEINGKIVINPPYDYQFKEIPKDIKNFPYLNCMIQAKLKRNKYHLSYLTTGLTWNAEYNLHLISDKTCNIDGWYAIHNNLNLEYANVNISLVSGEINFAKQDYNPPNLNNRMKVTNTFNNEPIMPSFIKTEEYHVFNFSNKINLKPKSQIRHKFLTNNEILYENIYHISHSLQRYRKNTQQNENIPINIRVEIQAKNIANFQLPGGTFNVYEGTDDSFTFIGSGKSNISEQSDIIAIETGKTREILCQFIIKKHEINRDDGEIEINAIFNNRKNKIISIIWVEKFNDGKWEIYQSDVDYKQLDTYTAQFNVVIPANSKKEVTFKAHINK